MGEKKFYWIKLHKDFFKRHDVRIIEAMPNGEKYVLFYMKLLLESVDHEGLLRFNDTIPYNDSMLSTITNTNIDIVRSAVKVFQEMQMMDILEDGTLHMEQVTKMLGYETEWAKKKREYRKKKDIVLPLSDKSIELEKELDIDIEKKEPPNPQRGKRFKPDLDFIESDEWRDLYYEWVSNKKSKYTKQIGVEKGYTSLLNISNNSIETARAIIDKSLANNWAGLFPIDNNSTGKKKEFNIEDYEGGTF